MADRWRTLHQILLKRLLGIRWKQVTFYFLLFHCRASSLPPACETFQRLYASTVIVRQNCRPLLLEKSSCGPAQSSQSTAAMTWQTPLVTALQAQPCNHVTTLSHLLVQIANKRGRTSNAINPPGVQLLTRADRPSRVLWL